MRGFLIVDKIIDSVTAFEIFKAMISGDNLALEIYLDLLEELQIGGREINKVILLEMREQLK